MKHKYSDSQEKNYTFVQNKKCEYFPCHKLNDDGEFNCLFCYCPLYLLGNQCGGNFSYTKNKIKNCSDCILPHIKTKGYEFIQGKMKVVIERGKDIVADNSI